MKKIIFSAAIFTLMFAASCDNKTVDTTMCKEHVKNCPRSENCPEHPQCEAHEQCPKDKDCKEHPSCEAFEKESA